MPAQRLKEYLDSQGIQYLVIEHSPAYTAQEIAASAHIPGRELAKTVVVKIDDRMAMAVLPSSYRVDLGHLADAVGAMDVTLASEEEFRGAFPQCELGAMPPFGNLYDMEVYVEASLTEDEEIDVNAGTPKELTRLSYGVIAELV